MLTGRSPVSLLSTYSAERQVIAQNLIDFDKEWSSLMAKKPSEFDDPAALGDFYVATAEFPSGFMAQYPPSLLIGEPTHQALAEGFPIGKRFKSAPVVRVADTNPVQLGHRHKADGRWRIYAFADATAEQLRTWAAWLAEAAESPLLIGVSGSREIGARLASHPDIGSEGNCHDSSKRDRHRRSLRCVATYHLRPSPSRKTPAPPQSCRL